MFALTLALVACAPHPAAPPTPAAGAAASGTPAAAATSAEAAPNEAVAAETVSPPVTLEQFRAAFPVGTRIRLAIAPAGQPAIEQRWTWTAADEQGCTIAATVHDANGALLKDEGAAPTTWAELMGHAVFPAASTTREDASVEVPAGRFDTWLYTVRAAAEDGTPQIERFHFARSLPGPPVLYTVEQGGAEVFRMTLLERTAP